MIEPSGYTTSAIVYDSWVSTTLLLDRIGRKIYREGGFSALRRKDWKPSTHSFPEKAKNGWIDFTVHLSPAVALSVHSNLAARDRGLCNNSGTSLKFESLRYVFSAACGGVVHWNCR